MMNVAFGGTLTAFKDDIAAPCIRTLAFGGLGCHTLALDVTLDVGVMNGVLMAPEMMWCDLEKRRSMTCTLAHDGMTHGLWRPNDHNIEA
jgi:hypothetical protein